MEDGNNHRKYVVLYLKDIVTFVKQLWLDRKAIFIWTGVFIVLGFIAALTMERTYTVSTVMVPQLSSNKKSSLSSLASLAGFDLGTSTSSSELSPLIYPQIVKSVPYRKELMYTPLHYQQCDSAVSMFTYETQILKLTVFKTIKKYTIGLPSVILKAIRGNKEPIVLPDSEVADNTTKPLVLTEDEIKILNKIGESVLLSVEKKEGYVTLTVVGSEPIQTAELAIKAQQLLQDEITRFRIEKSQNELDYIQARYNEVKKEAESFQEQLARITDRSQDIKSSSDRIERERIQSKYNIANGIYSELSKQLEQTKLQVKQDTPVFTIIQPVTVPSGPSNSRLATLIIWTILGFVLGCIYVLFKSYWPKVKDMFA